MDWVYFRCQAALAIEERLIADKNFIVAIADRAKREKIDIHTAIARSAIEHADALIEELRKVVAR